MAVNELWIGIDPGLVRTGIVAADTEEVLEYATYSAASGPDFSRAIGLAQAITDFIVQAWNAYADPEECTVRIALELPVWKHNPKVLIKQVRLLEEIEGQLFGLSGQFDECDLFEISPTQAKLAATGSGKATKDQIVEACPLDLTALDRDNREAVADAWAHYKSALTGRFERYCNLSDVIIEQPVEHERTL